MSEILRLDQLTITPAHAPERKLVNKVSLALSRGKTTCIVGESGSGKSLTALSIMQLLSSQLVMQGHVWFQGQDISQLNNQEMQRLRGRQIGMIFQEPMTSLNPVLTIGFQLANRCKPTLDLKDKRLNKK